MRMKPDKIHKFETWLEAWLEAWFKAWLKAELGITPKYLFLHGQ